MKTFLLSAASGLALALTATPAAAQHQHHSGMDMPPQPLLAPPSSPLPVQDPAQDPHAGHDMHEVDVADPGHVEVETLHVMTGALGNYPMARESSGTAWQPDISLHRGPMTMLGDWMLMAHGELSLVADTQGGPRGGDDLFVAGMLMGMAQRELAGGAKVAFKAMVSPDPLMGKTGYPLLLASGETADGVTRLVDRQHPHDFFMELSTSVSIPLSPKTSAFLYAALPGEPAFGPPAFMHRQSINISPEAPITHHWLDSTHISFGVLTAGLVLDTAKIEVSRFNGREPDERRWNIETAPLDSTAVRLSLNPTPEWALQASWGHFEDPEQLEPGVDQKRWSASAAYTRPMPKGWWATSLAWGRKTIEGEADDAFALESSLHRSGWTLFGRGEMTENRELVEADALDDHHGEAYRVGKLSLGLARDVDVGGPLLLTAGVSGAVNFVPSDLRAEYRRRPLGGMAFLRMSLK